MKILIVDDEVIIREGLSKVIDWERLGLELLTPAGSAEEALERMPAEKPQLILTDIRMEGMDGLAMAKEAKKLLPDAEIIMLTGYDDFEYMRQAIRHEVSDYLLKTSRPGDIIQAVLGAAQKIRDKWEARSKDVLKDKEARERRFEKMLAGDVSSEPLRLREYFPRLVSDGEEGARAGFQAMLIKASGWEHHPNSEQLLGFAVDNMLREMMPCETLLKKNRIVAVLRTDGGWGAEARIRNQLEKIGQLLKCTLLCAAGPAVEAPENVHLSYERAVLASRHWDLPDSRPYIAYESIAGRKGGRTVCSRQEEQELSQLLMAGDTLRLVQWVDARLGENAQHPELTFESFASYVQSVALSGLRWLERVAPDTAAGSEATTSFGSPEETGEAPLRDKLQQYLQSLMNAYHLSPAKGPSGYVQRVVAYIRENIGSRKLGLQEAARHVHVHPGHLSEVFRRETGVAFNDFLVAEKLERAREMLLDPALKISDIARTVGYEDVKYFSQLFKKRYAATPSEYREQAAKPASL